MESHPIANRYLAEQYSKGYRPLSLVSLHQTRTLKGRISMILREYKPNEGDSLIMIRPNAWEIDCSKGIHYQTDLHQKHEEAG